MKTKKKTQTFQLIDISKLADTSLFLAALILLLPLVLFVSRSLLTAYFIIAVLALALLVTIYLLVQAAFTKRDNPELYISFLSFLLIHYMAVLLSFAFHAALVVTTLRSLAIFLWLFACSHVILQVIQVFFVWTLKQVFPDQLAAPKEVQIPSLAKLSPYIDITTQKTYHAMRLGNTALSYIFFIFFAFCIQNSTDIFRMDLHPALLNWVDSNNNWFIFFNCLSLLALIITIRTFTYIEKNKMVANAYQRMKEEFNNRV